MNHWREESQSHKRNDQKQEGRTNTKINSFQTAETLQEPILDTSQEPSAVHPSPSQPHSSNVNMVTVEPTRGCLCGPNGSHECLADCPAYKQAQGIQEKWSLVWNIEGFCYRCLKGGHDAVRCQLGVCGKDACDRLHHITLHKPEHIGPKPRRRPSRSGQRPAGPRWQGQSQAYQQSAYGRQGLNPQAAMYHQNQSTHFVPAGISHPQAPVYHQNQSAQSVPTSVPQS